MPQCGVMTSDHDERAENASAADLTTHVPAGTYRVVYEHCEQSAVYGTERLFVHCRITSGEHAGAPLMRFYTKPRPGRRLARSSNLFRDYTTLIEHLPPASLHPAHFLADCELEAQVVTVSRAPTPEGDWEETHESLHYSKIERFLRITDGWPSGCLQHIPRGVINGNRKRKKTSNTNTTETHTRK